MPISGVLIDFREGFSIFWPHMSHGTWTTKSDHISIKRNCHCTFAASHHLLSPGRGECPHFLNPDPNLSIHLVTCRTLRRRLSQVIDEN